MVFLHYTVVRNIFKPLQIFQYSVPGMKNFLPLKVFHPIGHDDDNDDDDDDDGIETRSYEECRPLTFWSRNFTFKF